MAVYPGMVKNRGVRSSTIIVSADKAVGTPGSITSKAYATSARSQITQADADDPARLVKVIGDIQDQVTSATQAQRSNPFSAPCIVRGLQFPPGATMSVPHTLGRPYSDWHATSLAALSGATIAPLSATLNVVPPTPATPASKFLTVINVGPTGFLATLIIVGD